MKLDIEALAREAGMEVHPRKGQIRICSAIFTGCDSTEQVKAFARLIVERCAEECDTLKTFYEDEAKKYSDVSLYAAFRDGEATGAEACAAAIRQLLEDK